MRSLFAAALLLLTTVACGPERIPAPAAIPIPNHLNPQATEIAILSALAVRPAPAIFDPHQPMAANEYEQLVWNYYLTTPSRMGWGVESRRLGLVTGLIKRAEYHLRVAVHYDDRTARVTIVDSSGLDQTADSIHGRAAGWILKLESRIRTELDQMAARR
jgi:hypothetical protein